MVQGFILLETVSNASNVIDNGVLQLAAQGGLAVAVILSITLLVNGLVRLIQVSKT